MNSKLADDEQILARFGYRQQLKRSLGYFSSFAVSFSVVSITTGLFANYGDGLRAAGPAFIWTWPIVATGQLLLALVFARLARRIPLSGYAYHWTRQLAGPRLAWWAGWLMTIQFLTGMPGVCYALATYLTPYLGVEPTNRNVVLLTISGLVLIALINHFGIRIASLVNGFSVWAEIGGSGLVGLLLLIVATSRHTNSWGILLSHPHQPKGLPYLGAFAFSSLMSAWTITGFENAANLAEETHQPQRIVPRVIIASWGLGVVMGFLVLLGFTLAMPSLTEVEAQATPLFFIIRQHFPPLITHAEMFFVFTAMFGSALANNTTLTRIVWAMARDNQLPASSWLAKVSARRVPANAIWTVTTLAGLFVLWAKFEAIIVGIATLVAYLTYAVVVAATLKTKHEAVNTVDQSPTLVSRQVDSLPQVVKADSGGRWLSRAALIWILILLAGLSLPRSSWTNSLATLVAVAVGGAWYWFKIRDKPPTADESSSTASR